MMRIASAEALARLLAERLAESGEPGRAVTVAQLVERILPYPLVRERLGLGGKAEYDLALLRLLSDRVLLQLDPALQEAAVKELEEPEPDLRPLEKLSESLLRVRDPAVVRAPADPDPRADPDPPADPDAPADVDVPADVDAAAGADAAAQAPMDQDAPLDSDEGHGDGSARVETGSVAVGEESNPRSPEATPPRDASSSDTPSEAPPSLAAPSSPRAPSPREAPPERVGPIRPEAPPSSDSSAAPSVASPDTPSLTRPPRAVTCWSCESALPMREGVRFCPRCGVDQQAARCTWCGDRLEPGWSFCPRCGRALSGP